MNYIKSVIQELKKVTWPTFSEVNKYTLTVIAMVVLFSLYFAGTDIVFSSLLNWLFSLV